MLWLQHLLRTMILCMVFIVVDTYAIVAWSKMKINYLDTEMIVMGRYLTLH